jgi:hypothetical protein
MTLQAQAVVEKAHMVLAGGKNAGTDDAAPTRFACSSNATGPGAFGNQLSDSKGDPTKFNSLQIVIPDANAAAAAPTNFR